ncbi:MAG TPA: carboxypeptidase-like regulatory domain-containing protein [Kofleriaceae bacterium]
MPTPGEPRLATRFGIVVVLLAAVAGVWWWRHRTSEPATSTVMQEQRGSARPITQRSAPGETASLTVAVTDDHGPLAGATVRLAPAGGEVVAITTDREGLAHADRLEPGRWRISASATDHMPAALPVHALAAGADDRVAIRLVAGGRTLRGTVSDATGGPIAGARIDAARLSSLAEPGDAVATVVSGADGTYRMTVADGALLVAASSPDYAPQSRRVELGPAGAVVDFALVPGGVIEGIVRDERTREPVAGARVVARRDSPAMLLAETVAHRATSGADGRFRIGGLRPGAWGLGASDHARHARQPTVVGVGVAEQVSDIELLIGDGAVVRGRVIDDTGAPASGVQVRAIARAEGADAQADAAGGFTLEGLVPGSYSVTARGDGYVPAGTVRVAVADKDVDGVVVTVRRGLALRGHVEPRQVCDVQQALDERAGMMMLAPGGSAASTTATAADGEFQLGPIAGGPARLTARCASGDQGTSDVQIAAGMPEVILRVTPGGSIAGRVVDGDGKPVAGAGVVASDVSQGERTTIRNGAITSGVQGLTDAAGAYTLVGLAPGSYRLGALDRGRPLRLRGKPPGVELAAAEHKTGVDLAIDRPTGVISGTVTGPDGKPLVDAWVSVQQDVMAMLAGRPGDDDRGQPASRTMVVDNRDGGGADATLPPALTDAQGHYAIRGLPPATYSVLAEAQRGQLRARAGDVRPDATVDLRALPVTALSGTVTGPTGPAALFSVELDGPTRAQRSFTDGRFSFGRVDPGRYTVRVQSSEGNGQATIDVTAEAPATVAITLASNAVVTGKLVDAAGQPLAGMPVALVPDTGDGRLQVQLEGPPPTTGPDGSFRLEHRAGTCVLIVMRPPQPFTRRGIALAAGKTVDLGAINVDAPAGPGAPRP